MRKFFLFLRLFLSFTLFTLTAVVVWALNLIFGGLSQRFCRERLLRTLARTILKLFSVQLHVHGLHHMSSKKQVVYIANHSSTLDIFVLCALGLENTRFFLGAKTRKILPLAWVGDSTGVFFVPPQTDPEGRTACFAKATQILRKTRESVFLTPEGTRVLGGQIGKFNKGAFHLAVALNAPVVPIYIAIPPSMNPGKGFGFRQGTVEVTICEPIETMDWSLDTLQNHVHEIRNFFVNFKTSIEFGFGS